MYFLKKEKQTIPLPKNRFNLCVSLAALVRTRALFILSGNHREQTILYSAYKAPLFLFFLKHLFFHIDSVLGANLRWHINFPPRSTSLKRQWEMLSLPVLGVCLNALFFRVPQPKELAQEQNRTDFRQLLCVLLSN